MEIISVNEQVDMAKNKRLLNRYRFVEYETIRILAGWLPAVAKMEHELAMGRLLWEDAQHVNQLYLRLREVQTPAFRPPGDEALERLMQEAIHAPNEDDLLAAIYRVIKPALVEAYQWHKEQTFANPDAPTLYAFKHILVDEVEQVSLAAEVFADHPVGDWERYIADLLAAAGGITGNEERLAPPLAPACRTLCQAPNTGHGISMIGHEAPRITPHSEEILQAGMVVMLEHGIYYPGETEVRLEHAVLVTESGPEILTTYDLNVP
jgi:hypothetical protein